MGRPEGWGVHNFALFFRLLPQFSFFLLSLGGPSVEFWGCLKRRDPEMCTFGVLRLSCEAPAALEDDAMKSTDRELSVGSRISRPDGKALVYRTRFF